MSLSKQINYHQSREDNWAQYFMCEMTYIRQL